MYYYSTRDLEKSKKYTSAQVIKQGLADDGGLFIPESVPSLTEAEVSELCSDSYPVRAAKILSKFLTDYTYDELMQMDFGRFLGDTYANEKIVTLEDFLRYFGNKGLHLSLEIKQTGVEEASIQLVRQYAQNSHVIFTSFLWESIVALSIITT